MNLLKVFHTSDIHGNIYPTNYVEDRKYGLAKISQVIKDQVKPGEQQLIIDSGDLIQGNSLAFYNHKFNNLNPSIIDGFNIIGYDAISLGNHEFNFGLEYLKGHYQKFTGDILCANITGLPFATKPYQIYTYGDVRVGVIGLTTSFIPNWELKDNIAGLEFLDPVATYQKYEDELASQADIIIVNYHGGFEADLSDGVTLTEPDTTENVGSKLLMSFNSIDAILSGHQHRVIATKTNGVICMQPGANGANVSQLVIDLDQKKIVDYQLISCQGVIPDRQITDLYDQQNEACNQYLNTPLTKLSHDISITNVSEARLNGHPLLSFLGQAFTSYWDADIVALSLFDSAIGFSKEVTIRQVNQNYPFPNTIVEIAITGRQLIEAISQANEYYTLEDQQIVVSKRFIEPKLKHYNYDMYWGVNYTVTVTDSDNIISDVTVQGQPLELDKSYKMLVSNYRYNDRGDYPIYGETKYIRESQDDAIEILIQYLQANDYIEIDNTVGYKIKK